MYQFKNLLCESLSTTIRQFQYHSGPVINADSYIFFLHEIIYDAMFSRHSILWTHQSLYVGYIILHRQSTTLSIAWNTLRIHAARLKPTFCYVFQQIEKTFNEIHAVRMYVMMLFTGGLWWKCLDIIKFKTPLSSEFAYVNTTSSDNIISIA